MISRAEILVYCPVCNPTSLSLCPPPHPPPPPAPVNLGAGTAAAPWRSCGATSQERSLTWRAMMTRRSSRRLPRAVQHTASGTATAPPRRVGLPAWLVRATAMLGCALAGLLAAAAVPGAWPRPGCCRCKELPSLLTPITPTPTPTPPPPPPLPRRRRQPAADGAAASARVAPPPAASAVRPPRRAPALPGDQLRADSAAAVLLEAQRLQPGVPEADGQRRHG
jgi:hypothetical protein